MSNDDPRQPMNPDTPPRAGVDPNATPAQGDFKPMEQRVGPGMGGGGGAASVQAPEQPPAPEQPEKFARAVQGMNDRRLEQVIDQQTDLIHFPRVDNHSTPDTDLTLKAEDNSQVWKQFLTEQLYDTRTVKLEHFHLFEWFPLAPGKFHTPEAMGHRQAAYQYMVRSSDGQTYFSPPGKLELLEGGIGAVRLRPIGIEGEDYYFMTASSNGVCHEGFPVLIPRRFYGPLKSRMLAEGAVPVLLSGEMRYIPEDAVSFFKQQREIPLLYLHVLELQELDAPRAEVTQYQVSVAVSFEGEFEGSPGRYVSYASFDPASASSLTRAIDWLEQFYVQGQYKGSIITDFDQVMPRFPDAVFGLPKLMEGKLDPEQVREFLSAHGLGADAGQNFFIQYNEYKELIQGDKITVGNISTSSGVAIGRGAQADVSDTAPGH